MEITKQECLKLINPLLVDSARDRLMFCIFLFTGEQSKRLRSLRWKDLVDENWEVKKAYKLGEHNFIEVCDELESAILDHLERSKVYYEDRFGTELSRNDLVIYSKTTARGKKMTNQGITTKIIPKWYKILAIRAKTNTNTLRRMHVSIFQEKFNIQDTKKGFNSDVFIDESQNIFL